MHFFSISPHTGDIFAKYPVMDRAELNQLVLQAEDAYREWKNTPIPDRTERLLALAEVFESKTAELADLISREMGKLESEALAEIHKCAQACRFFANRSTQWLAPKRIQTEAAHSYVCYQPLGVILGIMPWNFPFWQVIRFAVPALAAGNAILLKHAPNVCGSAAALENCFRQAGFPEGIFLHARADLPNIPFLIEHPVVQGVAFTGSEAAGRQVGALAGKNLKKSVLELGGSDAYIILADADLDLAAEVCATSRLLNAGQSCISAKRFIAVESIYKPFLEKLKTHLENAAPIAPLARLDLRENLHRQVQYSIDQGAALLSGGKLPDTPGAYYPPTLLAEVRPGMPAFDEEVFGPVAALIRATDEKHAVELANKSRYGLGAAVFTRDRSRGETLARQEIEAGACFVNALVRSHPAMPFGGIKNSGYGRELSSEGLLEFVNTKSVWVE